MEDFIRQFTGGGGSAGNGDPCGVGDQKSEVDVRSDKPEVVSHSAHPGASGFFLVRLFAAIDLVRHVVKERPAGERF